MCTRQMGQKPTHSTTSEPRALHAEFAIFKRWKRIIRIFISERGFKYGTEGYLIDGIIIYITFYVI
jgi:hypothetical protein